jgi:spermidine synthase
MRLLTESGRFVESACSSDIHSVYPIDHVFWAGDSDVCEIVIAHSPTFGRCLFLDKEMQSSEADEAIYHEHLVHPVMASLAERPNKRVLIVGGGEGATAREVLKWGPESVSEVVWVDIDGDLVDLCRRHLCYAEDAVYNDPRLRFYAADIRSFLAQDFTNFDVIILDLPDPDVDELHENPDNPVFYTLYGPTFFDAIKMHLAPDGAIASHCGPISPGVDGSVRRAGLTWIRGMSVECGLGKGHAYHTTIPSFQSEWGFWMSCAPHKSPVFPSGLRIMDRNAAAYAFTWPAFWHVGHLSS